VHIATGDHDVRAPLRQANGSLLADAIVAAGDQYSFSLHGFAVQFDVETSNKWAMFIFSREIL
jgi:hypothetical protein